MRVQAPGTTPKDVWDYTTAAAIVAGTLGKLITDNVDGKISLAKADVSLLALEATQRGTDSALLAANYKQFTKGLTEHGVLVSRTDAVLDSGAYDYFVEVSGAGYLTGIWLVVKTANALLQDLIIEIDGTEVPPFELSPNNQGNIGSPGECICFETTWDADWKWVLMSTPMYRFDSSMKIGIRGNGGASCGVRGNATYLTE